MSTFWGKMDLKIKIFVGTTENALYIQIWTALIAILPNKLMQFKAASAWSLSNLVAFLRWNLLGYRNLWEWLERPNDTPPLQPPPSQQPMPFCGFSQKMLPKMATPL